MTDMTPEVAAKLRAKFPAENVGKLPRVWCPQCRDAIKNRRPNCDKHRKVKCDVCKNNMTDAHLHLDYIGHAAITDRLLQVDPLWGWEPVAFGEDGLPVLDRNGGLWIRLTVAGVTRLGYGDAEGKTGPSAVKESIGDALRNGAMRFGVGLDLWHKDGELLPESDVQAEQAPASQNGQRKPVERRSSPAVDGMKGNPDQARAGVIKACEDNGWDEIVVRKRFVAEHGMPLRDCTDAAVIARFRSSLFKVPQAELQPAAMDAVNGAAK